MNKIKNIITGILFLIIGITFLLYSLHYKIGNLEDIGTGFFPLVISVLLAFSGSVLIFKNVKWN